MNPKDIARYIDHTQLKPDAGESQIAQLCREAIEYSFYSVCVNSCWAGYCAEALKGSDVKLAVVAGFPLGAMETECKAFEARRAVEAGADEIDMVINVGFLKSGDVQDLVRDIKAVREACDAGFEGIAPQGTHGAAGTGNASGKAVLLKVIIETALLSREEKIAACRAAVEAGADFVKTSTGFSKGGATAEDVALMRSTVGPDIGVKASGGIRSYEDAVKMIESGATRLGASSGISIVTGHTGGDGY